MPQSFNVGLASFAQKWGIPLLRISLGIVFLWFGALKVFGVSPVVDLIQASYPFFPEPAFIAILGVWEMAIGVGFIFKIFLRAALILFFLQMLGTVASPFLFSPLFFSGNPLLLTTEGEFVVKNLVFIAAGLIIWGHEAKK